ncbi:hypothetical protein Tco_0784472 [Tanacetum coccineum]
MLLSVRSACYYLMLIFIIAAVFRLELRSAYNKYVKWDCEKQILHYATVDGNDSVNMQNLRDGLEFCESPLLDIVCCRIGRCLDEGPRGGTELVDVHLLDCMYSSLLRLVQESTDLECCVVGPRRCTPEMTTRMGGWQDASGRVEHDLMDFVPPTPHDSPLSGGHTPRSDEGRPNINELMAICTNLSNRVLALEQSKTAQDLVINKLQKKVKRLEKALRARTPGMKLFKIGTSRRKGLDKENVSKQGRKSDKTKPMFNDSDFDVLDEAMENVEGGSTAEQITTAGDTLNTASINVSIARPSNVSVAGPSTSTVGDIFKDEMTTIADTLVAIRSARPRTTSVMIRNVEEEPRRATPVPTLQIQDKGKGKMVKPEPTPKNPRKAQIQMDEELAQRLLEEEQAQFEKEQRIAREKAAEQGAKDIALIEQMEDVQARMDADKLLAERLQQEERE